MRAPEDVFEDFKQRRKGILRALTTEYAVLWLLLLLPRHGYLSQTSKLCARSSGLQRRQTLRGLRPRGRSVVHTEQCLGPVRNILH